MNYLVSFNINSGIQGIFKLFARPVNNSDQLTLSSKSSHDFNEQKDFKLAERIHNFRTHRFIEISLEILRRFNKPSRYLPLFFIPI